MSARRSIPQHHNPLLLKFLETSYLAALLHADLEFRLNFTVIIFWRYEG
jgi:hypothetical protein